MEASRLSCERRVDVSMCIHPDHSEVWALPGVATDRTKCQAGSAVAKSLVTISPSKQLQGQWEASAASVSRVITFPRSDICDNKGSTPYKLHGLPLL